MAISANENGTYRDPKTKKKSKNEKDNGRKLLLTERSKGRNFAEESLILQLGSPPAEAVVNFSSPYKVTRG